MYHFLTEATKRRFIEELRLFWSYHPKYRDIVDHIQESYSFKERPQYGIILESVSASPQHLSADNFQGTVESYCYLTGVEDSPGLSIEWVREDAVAIQKNGGRFPSAPGIYYIEIVDAPASPPYSRGPQYAFFVDPLLEIQDESLLRTGPFTWQTQNPLAPGTLRLFQMPGAIQLVEGVEFTVDPDSGLVTTTNPLPNKDWLSADYRYPAPSTGPWGIQENFSNTMAIPGVVLAFGRRMEKGDRLAVVVHNRRQPTAMEYGGRWNISLSFNVLARSNAARNEITDSTLTYIEIIKNRLSTQGIEITDGPTMGGTGEDTYDENGDDYYYTASISVDVQTDWAVYVPIAQVIRRVSPQNQQQMLLTASLSDAELANIDPNTIQNIKVMESLGLRYIQDPFFAVGGRLQSYPVIR